ncbi:MAG: hypothetical protein ACW986_01880 [Promethearchaeota archaeon]|jgi:hypothetical protein
MPRAIILYEIDQSFGPNILAEYYLKQDDKIPSSILKDFAEKHVKKGYSDVTIVNDNNRFYSNKLSTEDLKRENLFLSFILQAGEDFLSIKSIFEDIEKKIIQNFSTDKKKMSEILKEALNSILNLIQKLQEPTIIKEILNERTKGMLDNDQLQEAKELIDLGEEIPEKLADEVKVAEELLSNKLYRKAKKSFQKASELAALIQEETIASFLENKGEQVGMFPDLIKERETIYKEIEKMANELENNKLNLYNLLGEPVDRLIEISNNFEEVEIINKLTNLKKYIKRSSQLAMELEGMNKKIKDLLFDI